MTDNEDTSRLLLEQERLRHENKFLGERVKNLQTFKTNFFKTNTDLIVAQERIAALEQQLTLEKVKERIVSDNDSDEAVAKAQIKQTDDILSFLKGTLLTSEYQQLVESIFSSVDETGLIMTVQIASEDELLDYCTDEETRDSSIKLLNHYKSSEEFVKAQVDAIVFNFTHVSVLVERLPVEDEIRAEQLKEFVSIVSMAANSRIDSIKKEIELETLRRNIYRIFKKTRRSFEDVQDNIDNQTISISEIFLGFEKNLKDSLKKMSLPDEYMKMLNMLLHDTKSELNLLLTSNLTVDESFLKAIIKLEDVYSAKYAHIDDVDDVDM